MESVTSFTWIGLIRDFFKKSNRGCSAVNPCWIESHEIETVDASGEAENILLEDPELVSLPLGLPTFEHIEERRETVKLEEDLIPNELFL